MLGLASKGKPAVRACPALSHVHLSSGETAKVRADWAFVSGVSLVPPYLNYWTTTKKKTGNGSGGH